MDEFFNHLDMEKQYIADILSKKVPIKMSEEDKQLFSSTLDCHICEEPLGSDRVRDHDHLTGQYRGAAHNVRNLKFRFVKGKNLKNARKNNKGKKIHNNLSFFIPVIINNLRGWDSHLIMESLGKKPSG